MSEIQELGQQISRLQSDSSKAAVQLNTQAQSLRQTASALQQLMRSTSQGNYQTMINQIELAQRKVEAAAMSLIVAARSASEWLDAHVSSTVKSASFSQISNIAFAGEKQPEVSKTPYDALSDYMLSHNYGDADYPVYSNDPVWRVLHKAAFPEYELPLIEQKTALELLGRYMSEHNYGKKDEPIYMQDPVWQELNRYAFPKAFTRPELSEASEQYVSIVDAVKRRHIEYLNIAQFGRVRSSEEIIETLGSCDNTDGSCSSLAFAYAGNLAGYDVLDFRGGESRRFFSSDDSIMMIADLPDVNSSILRGKDEIACTNQLLLSMTPGKEYYLATGRHAAIVKKVGDNYEYLELQSTARKGWHILNDDVLQNRFRCQRSFLLECPSFLIEVESLSNSQEFLGVLGYLNTAETEQMKGETGYAR